MKREGFLKDPDLTPPSVIEQAVELPHIRFLRPALYHKAW
jgi:hypothetical protein